VAARDACYKVISHKVPIIDHDRLEKEFTKDELFATLGTMKNGKCPGIDGLSCAF
jgi:hypothetical protein